MSTTFTLRRFVPTHPFAVMAPLQSVAVVAATLTSAAAFLPVPARGARRALAPRTARSARAAMRMGSPDEFVVGVLGDLHMDPRKMEDYEMGRGHWLPILEEGKAQCGDSNVALVSLGDLGESKV